MSCSSSSDEEENNELLKEALFPGFALPSSGGLNQRNGDSSSSKKLEAIKNKKSLRKQDDDDDHNQNRDFRAPDISHEQQNFIAKKLAEFLDKEIAEDDLLIKRKWSKQEKRKDNKKIGVRLLKNSKTYVKSDINLTDDDIKKQVKPKIKRRCCDKSELSFNERVKEAAVTPEWVLQKQGAYGKLCHKGEIITDAIHCPDFQTKLSAINQKV